jgi:hypothetical protein
MPDPTNPAPSPAPSPAPPKVHRSVQNKIITSYVTDAERFLTTALDDPEIQPILAEHGYDAAELAQGLTLVKNASGSVAKRQEKLGGKKDAVDELHLGAEGAREAYARFREIARASFPDQADRLALGLTGDVPEDFQRFVTAAHTSYTNAGKGAYADKMKRRNYAPDRLKTLLENLDGFTGDKSKKDEAAGEAIGSTEERNSAYVALRAYMKELKGVARGALRGKPGLRAKLEL